MGQIIKHMGDFLLFGHNFRQLVQNGPVDTGETGGHGFGGNDGPEDDGFVAGHGAHRREDDGELPDAVIARRFGHCLSDQVIDLLQERDPFAVYIALLQLKFAGRTRERQQNPIDLKKPVRDRRGDFFQQIPVAATRKKGHGVAVRALIALHANGLDGEDLGNAVLETRSLADVRFNVILSASEGSPR